MDLLDQFSWPIERVLTVTYWEEGRMAGITYYSYTPVFGLMETRWRL